MASHPDTPPLEAPLAQLERSLIDDYLRTRGEDAERLRARHDAAARALLADACTYAATKLSEVESRAHYVHDLRKCSDER